MSNRLITLFVPVITALMLVSGPLTAPAAASPELRAEGRHFKAADGRTVILRGINVAGNSKVPPFVPFTDMSKLDPLKAWGYNAIRLLFNWEAYEPFPGQYNDEYLSLLVQIANAAWQRGIYTIVDFHQDGFSRYSVSGCGDGFPGWALPPEVTPAAPDNSGGACHNWGVMMTLDPGMHTSWSHFYADTHGVRTRYLMVWNRIVPAFVSNPGVIGYDLLNEPWGWEAAELLPLYEDAAAIIRSIDPTAILFIEGHVTTNGGLQTTLPKPSFGNFAYAPHFYEGLALVSNYWSGITWAADMGYWTMNQKAQEWNVPLFVGEFGIGATATNGLAYVDLNYTKLDDYFASGAYWNYTPGWDPALKDRWNGEDLSIVTNTGATRPTFRHRAYTQKIPGTPQKLKTTYGSNPEIEIKWAHNPSLGRMEAFVPKQQLWGNAQLKITVDGTSTGCWFNDASTFMCQSTTATTKSIRVRKCVMFLGACL